MCAIDSKGDVSPGGFAVVNAVVGSEYGLSGVGDSLEILPRCDSNRVRDVEGSVHRGGRKISTPEGEVFMNFGLPGILH